MDLFNPESGLVIWMLVVFLLLMAILAKFAFPVISKAIGEREERINNAVKVAEKAEERLRQIDIERNKVLGEAHQQQSLMLEEVKQLKEKLVNEAREEARKEGERMRAEASAEIEAQKNQAMKDIRQEVARLSVEIAGKVLQENLSTDKSQMALVNKLIDAENISKS
ncbi:MAG: F0F1 ATP synthase subunit B [Paludibacteraceae bacterium]|jgi:F-type H+-transporting ATPase subunit b|nr:F0F1 ATP synthase subunit B [Paludibacteraceae bacterium]MCR4619705.1 F0F1 ATP synthase subunit B [Paludibacteraceae bacterium]